jgi:drug/metabolite transporter (DMT)-like permease
MTRTQANLCLLSAGAIWGGGFVAQSTAMEYVGPMVFTWTRFFCAFLVLLPFAVQEHRKLKEHPAQIPWAKFILVGLFLFLAIASQQYGLLTTSVSNSGFLTGLYVIFVPLIGYILFRDRPHKAIWPGAALALTGIYLLTGAHATEIVPGDVLTVICAVLWGLQILFAGKAMAECPRPLTLAATQFGVCIVLAFLVSLSTERIDPLGIALAAPEILFAGIISGGLAFTLQIIGQRHTTPAAAALILSTEALFAAVFAAILLNERLGPTALVGGLLIIAAILVVELAPLMMKKSTAQRVNSN